MLQLRLDKLESLNPTKVKELNILMKLLEEKQEKQLEQEQDKMSKVNLKRKNWLRKKLEQKIHLVY